MDLTHQLQPGMTSMTLRPFQQFIKSEPTAVEDQSSGMDTFDGNNFRNTLFSLKNLVILLVLILLTGSINAQRKADIGFFAGTSYYMGDINPSTHFYSPSIAVGPIIRYNFHLRSSVRFSGIYHKLKADPADFTIAYPVPVSPFNASFIDLALNYEFNFIPYKTSDRKNNQSFYTGFGLGYQLKLSPDLQNSFTIPFAVGYKFNAGKKLSAGIEFASRKTFYDGKIDGVLNIGKVDDKFHLVGNNDWYTFAGIFITYKIFNFREDCPTYD